MLKRKLALALAITTAATVFTGCGKGKQEATGGDTFETAPVIRYAVRNNYESQLGKSGDDYNDNDYIRYIWEKTGVRVEPVLISTQTNEVTQQLATKRAGGEQIDLICYFDLVQAWMQSNLIIPLNDIFKEYGDDIKGWNPYSDDCKTPENGWKGAKKIDTYWGIPGRGASNRASTRYFYFRKDWMNKLGLSMPKSSQELGQVMKAFTEQDPDGNGKKDTWGMAHRNTSSTVNELLLSLGVESWREYRVNDKGEIDPNGKKLISCSMHPFARKQYAQIREWCKNGYLNEDGITDDTAYEKLIVNGKIGIVLDSYSNVRKWNQALKDNGYTDAEFELCPEYIVNSSDGKFYGFTEPGNMGSVTMITSMAKKENYPNIIKLMNWMYSEEGTFFQTYGLEGREYKMDGDKVVFDEQYDTDKSYRNMFMFGRSYEYTYDEEIDRTFGDDELAEQFKKYLEADPPFYTRYTDVKFNYPNLPEFTTYPDWRKGVEQYLLLFTVGDKDPMNDKDWNEYLKICESYGIQKLMDAAAKEAFGS